MAKQKSNKSITIVLKNHEIEAILANNSLRALMTSRDLPVAITFGLEKLGGAFDGAIHPYLSAKRALAEKYADRDAAGTIIQEAGNFVFSAKSAWFMKDYNELLGLETTIDCARQTIHIKDIPDRLLSPADIRALRLLINFEE